MKFAIITELYHLEPREANTPFKESLTSYISRLAEAHSVTVGTLINKVIGPRLNLVYLMRSSRYGGSRFYDLGYELNGFGKLAEHTSGVMSQLCGLFHAEDLTFLKWKNVFPPRELLRQYKAWCPLCLDDWKESENDVFEPLLWSIELVDSCTKHRILLETVCPCCEKRIPVLSRKSRNGYCSFCGNWLGSKNQEHDINHRSIEVNSRSYYFSLNIEQLLLMRIEVKAPLIFVNNVISFAGGLCAFCRSFSISKASASTWINEKSMPSLYIVLSICCSLQLNAYYALSNPLTGDVIGKCSAIPKLHVKQAYRKINWVILEKQIIDIIARNEMPPSSVREVARVLGYDRRLLYTHFPELCKEISNRHLIYIEDQKRKRISWGEQELASAIHVLNSSGTKPSRRKIESLLPCNVSLREEEFKKLWKILLNFENTT